MVEAVLNAQSRWDLKEPEQMKAFQRSLEEQQHGFRAATLAVVDEHLALYSWSLGEEDIEWYHPIDSSFMARKPLIEA